jgi:hypothetical protein
MADRRSRAHAQQVEEQIDEVEEIVRSRPHFEFQAVRIEDAFDPTWWAKVSGSSSSDLELHALLFDDGMPFPPTPLLVN